MKQLDEGSTVPFIARYRKEATDGLDDIQLRALEERLGYLRELAERRAAYLKPAFETKHGTHPGVADARAALDGARQILMDRFAEDAELLGSLRNHLREHGVVTATVAEGKEETGAKFRDYFAYSEPYARVAPHRPAIASRWDSIRDCAPA